MATHPLQSAGNPISFADINLELNRSSTAEISIDTAENGGYGTINRCSSPSPNGTDPAAISEWYGYNHNASSTNLGTMDTNTTSCASICAENVAGTLTLYLNTAGSFAYTDSTCNTLANTGYYADMSRTTCYTVGASGAYSGSSACATTTTTTTTTLATGNCYEVYQGNGSTTVYWTSTDGNSRSATIAVADGTKYICSLITPYETNPADLVVSAAGSSCTNNCQILTCKPCTYP